MKGAVGSGLPTKFFPSKPLKRDSVTSVTNVREMSRERGAGTVTDVTPLLEVSVSVTLPRRPIVRPRFFQNVTPPPNHIAEMWPLW